MRLIDLSVTIEEDAVSELVPPKIEFRSHTGAGLAFFKEAFGITEEDLLWSGGTAPGDEIFTFMSHTGRQPPQLSPPPAAYAQSSATVPLMGRIAAGVPISAIQDHTQDIGVPPDLIAGGEHFALEVKGDSMIDAGINEGDSHHRAPLRHRQQRRHRRRAGGEGRSDAQAPAQEGRVDRARSRQPQLRDPHLRPRPGRHPGPPRRAHTAVLSFGPTAAA